MSALVSGCFEAPDWRIDWDAACATFPILASLDSCPQDPRHHAEGDVGVHTRMVLAALVALPAFRALDREAREEVYAAALLHDIGKPGCTRHESDGTITSRGHSRRGAILARRLLWERGCEPVRRERVVALIRWHQTPFHLLTRADARPLALAISWTTRADHLAVLAAADARGRIAADGGALIESVALFAEYCADLGCLDRPYPFPSARARVAYFRDPTRDPDYAPFGDGRARVTLLSGLPGAGKDRSIAEHGGEQPVVGLDAIRAALRVEPTEPQGAVIAHARELAREHLRAGRSFIWNGTNLSRTQRAQTLDLCHAYDAVVEIVYVEAAHRDLWRRNAARSRAVPEAVITRLLSRWEVPDATEAACVRRVWDN
ncbi:MAG TPA: AAA family ATPase [Thermomicrobiales bacterium]|jgi:putative nucleotidyltransferase with HDIG domain